MDINNFLNDHENKSLLRFLTCGSVDDGKSTLIGRLLYDSKLIFDDQLSALQKDSEKVGNAGEGEIDYALLLDGLKAEREQGITIDVAYRYFATPKRKFIIADTPGHEQYTRNMATGASTCDLAIILIDARKGILTQTRRHSFIVSLLGIKNVVIAINKMDLVDYSKEVFDNIRQEYKDFAKRLNLPNIEFFPLSALRGDNIVEKSEHTPWYTGKSLLQHLEDVDVSGGRNLNDFRFPVQTVIRPDLNFRGFAGTVQSGVVRVGDRIKALPSQKESTVKRIATPDGDLEYAFSPQAVVIELADEIDISSGEMIVHANNVPNVSKNFDAMVVWMSETPLNPHGQYLIKHTTRTTKARIESLKYQVDVNTLQKNEADKLDLNEIGRAIISTPQPLFFDAYADNRETGAFILIDQITNNTVAAGMIIESVAPGNVPVTGSDRDVLEEHISRREFGWEEGKITAKDRAARYHHQAKTVVLVGKQGVGKREVATALEEKLFNLGMNTYYLGISNVIGGLDADVDNNFVNRDEHVRRLGELSRIMTGAGQIFITCVDDLDDYELSALRLLNQPHKLIVINIGESNFVKEEVDLSLSAHPKAETAVGSILSVLGEQNIIPEYCI